MVKLTWAWTLERPVTGVVVVEPLVLFAGSGTSTTLASDGREICSADGSIGP